ncbi:hypothetical protein VKS41_003688 [Umbelopsis sp. WA50703]
MIGQKQRSLSAIALLSLGYFASAVLGHRGESGTEDGGELDPHIELNPHWSILHRNVIGSPSEILTNGPFVRGATGLLSSPPFGVGSLSFLVGPPTTTPAGALEKASFGNEVDYYGKFFQEIKQLGFHVYTTGENAGRNPVNLPGITLEVYFRVANTLTYTSVVWAPPPSAVTVGEWSRFIDATKEGTWFLSQDATIHTGCSQATPCPFSQLMQQANTVDPAAFILSIAVAKGRDFEWQGAIDGLRINDKIIDFEIEGVYEISDNHPRGENEHHFH